MTEPLAVVVGATGALGGAIVHRLRSRGLPVLAVARSAEALAALAADDEGVGACAADVGDDGAGEVIAEALRTRDLPVRMVVQAAGLPALGGLDVVEPAALGAAVALKVGGLLRLVRAADPWLGDGARIVALGGHYGAEPSPHVPGAGVTNAALANLVRQLADAYGARGITVHLVAPGPADTDRLRRLSSAQAASRGIDVADVLAERRAESPLGAMVTPEQVGWAVATLLDPEASALTGSTLALDMGARRGI